VTADDAREVAEDVLSRPRSLTVIGPFDDGTFDEFVEGSGGVSRRGTGGLREAARANPPSRPGSS
jgi:hypothetical protein